MESKTDRILSKSLESMFIVYDKTVPKIKTGAKIFLVILGIMLLGSIILVTFGIATEKNSVVTFGCILKTIVSLAGLLVAVPLLIALESIGKGEITGRGTVKFLAAYLLTQLIISLLILWSPMSVSFKTFFTLNLAALMLSLTFAVENTVVKAVPGFIFAFAVGTLFFPTWGDRLFGGIERFNEPRLLPLSRGTVFDGKDPFFVKGNPAVWYFLTPDGTYELFDHKGKHDIYGSELKPITAEIVRKLMRNQSLISPRNFSGGVADASPSSSAGSYATSPPPAVPETPPAPAPYVPSPPAAPEVAQPPAVEIPRPAPAPSYQPSAPEKAKEKAPVPRYKYATLFIGDSGAPDPSYSQDIASWFDSDGVSAADTFRHLSLSYRGTLLDSDRRRLGSLAENIVLVKCSTYPSPSRSRDRYYACDLETKVIDTRTGRLLKSFHKDHKSSGSTDQTARNSAITLALAKVKNNLP